MPILLCPAESGQTSEPPGCSRAFFRHQPRVFWTQSRMDLQQFWNRDVLKCGFAKARFRIEGKEVLPILLLTLTPESQGPGPSNADIWKRFLLSDMRRREYDKVRSSANLSLMVHVWFPICWTPCLEGFLQAFSVLCLLVVHWELGSDMKIWARALLRKGENPPHLSLLFGEPGLQGGPGTPRNVRLGRTPMESPEMMSFDEDGRDFGSKVFDDVWCKSEDSDACAFGECFLFSWKQDPLDPPTKSLARGVN